MARMTKARRAEELFKRLSERGDLQYDPIMELVRIAKAPRTNAQTKVKIAETIMSYLYPKQKAVEIDNNQGQAVTFNFDLSGDKDSEDATCTTSATTALTK